MCLDPVNKGRASDRCALRNDPRVPLRENPHSREASFGPSQLTSQYFEENLPLNFRFYLSLNPKKAIPGLPTVLEDFTDMVLFSLSAEQNV